MESVIRIGVLVESKSIGLNKNYVNSNKSVITIATDFDFSNSVENLYRPQSTYFTDSYDLLSWRPISSCLLVAAVTVDGYLVQWYNIVMSSYRLLSLSLSFGVAFCLLWLCLQHVPPMMIEMMMLTMMMITIPCTAKNIVDKAFSMRPRHQSIVQYILLWLRFR